MKILASSILAASTVSAFASPRVESDSITLRHDMLLLKDSGRIGSAVMTWPWPMGRQTLASEDQPNEIRYDAPFERFQSTYKQTSKLGFKEFESSISVASDTVPFRSFGYQPREQFEASASQSWLSEWFAGNLSLTYAADPADGDEFRLDGSYLAVALGNWSFGIDQVERWWGPGWDGSLILSDNARPIPAVSLTRISPDHFESKWLSWIGPWTFTTFMGQLDNEERTNSEGIAIGSDALLFGMRIDFSPFGWDNLDIGLSRTAQWAGEGRPSGFDTFWKLMIGEDNVVSGSNTNTDNEPGNQLAGIDYRLRIPGINFAQYAQLIGEDEETYLPDACMLLVGGEAWGKLDALNATWRAYYEWADTRAGYLRRDPAPNNEFNIAYNHHIYRSGYRYHGQSIGHAMDGDGIMRSIGAFVVGEHGNLWGTKYRNYSLNRDGLGPNSVTIDPVEGYSFELFAELRIIPFLEKPNTPATKDRIRPKLNLGLHYISEENQITNVKESDLGGYLSISQRI